MIFLAVRQIVKDPKKDETSINFAISLSLLSHLGRTKIQRAPHTQSSLNVSVAKHIFGLGGKMRLIK